MSVIYGTPWRMSNRNPVRAGLAEPHWQRALRSSIAEEAFGQRLQDASRCGRPLGDELFVENLGKRCGRRLRAQPVGRPKKLSENDGHQLLLGYGV